jgi:hypothetical protein
MTATSSHSQVCFLRAWTWLASPDTVFVLQSDRTVLELSCNDFLAACMEVPSVRSRRLLPPRTVIAAAPMRRSCTDAAATITSGNSSSSSSAYASDWWLLPLTSSGLPCAPSPDVLPLWGRESVLSGVFVPRPPPPAYHSDDSQTLVFSRLTGFARRLLVTHDEKNESEAGDHRDDTEGEAVPRVESAHDTLHLCLLADTETVSSCCISIRLCLTPQCVAVASPAFSAASPTSSTVPAQRVVQESVNINIARVLCDTAAPALFRLEHGFYFVGSREESAYADYPFIVAGLQYVESVVQAARGAQLRVAMVCVPANRQELRRLYDTAKAACSSGGGDGCAAFAPTLSLPPELKRTLRQAVRHAQVQTLPVPQFDFEVPQAGQMTKQLLSCAFQLSNDGVVPCVWCLWAPVFPHNGTTAAAATGGTSALTTASPLPPPQSLQLTMQSFYVAAESQQLLWRPPELVHMDDFLASNPSQVFALSSCLTKGGSSNGSAATAALPASYKSLDDVLLDVDAAVVAPLFLYYADRKLLVLATVETGSNREAGLGSEVIDDAYNFASRARNGRIMGGRLFAGSGNDSRSGGGDGRQYLRLVPHAAAEMNAWKGDSPTESLGCTLLSAVQLSAVLVNDHGEPALQVALTSRRFGVALSLFPLPGRRGSARVSATLQPVKVYLYRRWDDLLCVTAAVTQQAEECGWGGKGTRSNSSRGTTTATSPTGQRRELTKATVSAALGVNDVQHSPLLRRFRAWVDTVAYPSTTYAAVPLAEWVWPPAGPGADDDSEGKENKKEPPTTSATAAAQPVLLLQRGRVLYVPHQTGAAVQMCSSLLHCSPLQVIPCAGTSSTRAGLYLRHGSYSGLLACTRHLRQLQLQYGPYPFYADVTVSSQPPAVKVKWFKKFLKSTNSAEAARRRAQERPHQTAWLQHVCTPSVDDLAYQFTPSSGATRPQKISAALECLIGTEVTHVGNVMDVNFSDPIRLATLAVEALAASHGMQQLVSAAAMLTDSLRATLRHLTTVLGSSGADVPPRRKVDAATPMSVMRGNWTVVEALARLPLLCVMEVMGQEVRRAAAAATAAVDASAVAVRANSSGGVSDVRQRSRLAYLQRWWWLLMRSSALVTAVNAVQSDAASHVMSAVFAELPLSSPLLQLPEDEVAATHTVSQALLLCSPRFTPQVVTQMLQRDTKSVTQQLQRLEAAVKAALVALGAEETTAVPLTPHDDATKMESADSAANTSEQHARGKEETTTARATLSWSSLFSTVRMDGAHWSHAVYYTNLLTHLRNLASDAHGVLAEEKHKDDAKNNDSVRALAAQCLAHADAAVEASAAAVLEVATQTVGVLLGAVVDVPATSRSRMADAVAQSASKRQQLMQSKRRPVGQWRRPAMSCSSPKTCTFWIRHRWTNSVTPSTQRSGETCTRPLPTRPAFSSALPHPRGDQQQQQQPRRSTTQALCCRIS